jgi:hypothetical protein
MEFGEWHFIYCDEASRLRSMILKHASIAIANKLPFRFVTPEPNERFETCVPLTSLRGAAVRFSDEQTSFDDLATWSLDWIAWDNHPCFEPGMFVARLHGKSMEPEVPDGAYCLFAPLSESSRQGKRLLVWHPGIDDPMTRGHYTLKVYTSESIETPAGWHVRVVLKPLNPEFERAAGAAAAPERPS